MFSCGEIGHKLRWIVVHLCIKNLWTDPNLWKIQNKAHWFQGLVLLPCVLYTSTTLRTSSCFPRNNTRIYVDMYVVTNLCFSWRGDLFHFLVNIYLGKNEAPWQLVCSKMPFYILYDTVAVEEDFFFVWICGMWYDHWI